MTAGTAAGASGVGALVRGYRLRAGLTQAELSTRAGVSVRTLRDLERGRTRRPHAPALDGLADALRLSPAERDELRAVVGRAAGAGTGALRVDVLGPLDVRRGDRPLRLGSANQRCLLALLALGAGRVVGQQEIVDVLWADDPPRTAVNLVHVYVSRLRRDLADAAPGRAGPHPGDQLLAHVNGGYRLDLSPGESDVAAFDAFLADADRLVSPDGSSDADPAAVAEAVGAALGCWRGPVLAGAEPRLTGHPWTVELGRRRVDAAARFADRAARVGRHREAVLALGRVVADEPLHEGLHARLMRALLAQGEPAAALDVFRVVRARLAEELGLDPGDALRSAYVAVLRRRPGIAGADDAVPAPPSGPTAAAGYDTGPLRPAQLPPDMVPFVGRADHLHRLDEPIRAERGDAAPGTTFVITGMAGIGKTALAVRWAQRVRERFPDGQLFVDLRGFSAETAARPIDVLARFLRALGVPGDRVPPEQDEATDMFRSLTAERALLVVLDNAADAAQVRPLLPGGPRCVTVVTSRGQLSGLVARQGAIRLGLEVLSPADAHALLARRLGNRRTDAEPEAVRNLVDACGALPLALQIAAANLLDRGDRPIAGYVAEIISANRLSALSLADETESALPAAFFLSYRRLPADARRLFRLLGVLPLHDVTPATAAALVARPEAETGRLLALLCRAHLLRWAPPDRYGCHDLLRLYARDRARREDTPAQRRAAVQRWCRHHLARVHEAADVLYPTMLRLPADAATDPDGGAADNGAGAAGTDGGAADDGGADDGGADDGGAADDGADARTAGDNTADVAFPDEASAAAWLDAERGNLIAVITRAARLGLRSVAWRLGDALRGHFTLGADDVGWLAVGNAALAAATADGDLRGQAAAHLNLAGCLIRRNLTSPARRHALRMLGLAEESGWLDAAAAALGTLGELDQMDGQPDDAVGHYERALDLNRRTGRLAGQAINLNNLGLICQDLGRLHRAVELYDESLALERRLGSRTGEAISLLNLGDVHRLLGQLDTALSCLSRAALIARETAFRMCEAEASRTLALVWRDLGDDDRARRHATEALDRAREIGYATSEVDALNVLGDLARAAGDPRGARERHLMALRTARDVRHRPGEVRAMVGLALLNAADGEPEAARRLAERATASSGALRWRLLHADALAGRARVERLTGAAGRGAGPARQALAIYREVGHPRGETGMRRLLADGPT
ncbi:BTAD domain-containing putative transcriptional regulator [Micromonospora sp. RP3T]|uniref:BTAD domain-containing putative transcriptional regulator n=1 Tax=Micromonospora sp. RP3T TaxID=2135446 RepID=UPI001304C23A|nr:BTAD domain-containing putative transcriptional regulator [Micromonospora sp. RP3T]